MSDRIPYECNAILHYFDTQTGNEPSAGIDAKALRHVESCPDCAAEMGRRAALRRRLKQALSATSASPDLEARIRASVRQESKVVALRQPWIQTTLRVAAVALVCFGVWAVYEVGRVRFETASQDLYIRALQARVEAIFGAGLGDHLHCARFRKFPAEAPSYDSLLSKMGPEYSGLVSLVRTHVPQEFEIVMAHRCSYQNRQFIHVALRTESNLASLVITEKRNGEAFPSNRGTGLHHAAVRGYQITAMESSRHLIYFISDFEQDQNRRLLAGMGREVAQFLETLEG